MLTKEQRAHELALEILRLQCQKDAIQMNYQESADPPSEICTDAIEVYQDNYRECLKTMT